MAKKSVQNEQGGQTDEVFTEKNSKENLFVNKNLVVVAPFEMTRNFQKIEYNVGDVFSLPEGWTRDVEFEEFRKINKKQNDNGMAFSVPNPVLDEKGKLKYMDSKRVLLPLKEV